MIEQMLQELKMHGALDFYRGLKETDIEPEQLLHGVLKQELEWKASSRLKRKINQAHFPFIREWGQVDEEINPQIPFKKLMAYSSGKFLEEKRNLCFIGTPGLGKTHSMVSIGRDLCRQGHSVLFFSAIDLVNQLEEAKENHILTKLLAKLKRPDFLIVDELGFVPFTDEGSRLLFEVFSMRYETGSIGVTTNLSLPKWLDVFGSIELTNALIDRFTHRCDIQIFEGESFRFRESVKEKK
jgi:DNA replication protein DnaC